jgi:hypothetical protein
MVTLAVRDADYVVVAYGAGIAPEDGHHLAEVDDATWAAGVELHAAHPDTRGVTWDGATLGVLPDDETAIAARAVATASATRLAAQQTILGALSSTPINEANLETNLEYLAAFLGNATVAGIGQEQARMASLISTMVTFVGTPAPTAEEAFAAVRAVCESSVITQRVTLNVLADVIRYVLQRG